MKISKIGTAKLWPTISCVMMILIVLMGCTASNYGRLASNPDVTQAFQAYQILPDHTYYYRGSSSRPFVIVGIHKDFTLDSPLWVKIDANSEDFRNLVSRVSLQATGRTTEPWGFNIIDQTGRKVGVWYSAIRNATVEVDQSGRIAKLLPIRTVTRRGQGM